MDYLPQNPAILVSSINMLLRDAERSPIELGEADISLMGALAMSIGIDIQNIPEGAIISMPMRAAGNSRWRSFLIGSLSGVVEPVGGPGGW